MIASETRYIVEMTDNAWDLVGGGWLRMTETARSTADAAREEREAIAATYPTRRTRIVRETTTVELVEEHDRAAGATS